MNEDLSSRAEISDLFSLSGRTVVVTGAGSGLGKAIAEACAGAGGAVVCSGRSDSCEQTADAIRDAGGTAVAVQADVSDESAVANLLDEAAEQFDGVDVLFCNAGTSDHYKPVDETTLEEWEHVVRTDLTSTFLCAKHALRYMIPRKTGKIVMIGSVWGEIGSDTIPVPSYAAAKGGVVNLTRELAMEYVDRGITVNCLSPGFFVTGIGSDKTTASETIDRLIEGALSRTPIHRIMDPSEIQGAAVFLAAPASDPISGHVLRVDGGLLAC